MAAELLPDASHGLLAVFAHPDDESLACGSLLALCSDLGIRTRLLCLTHGEHGPGPGPKRLRALRAGELSEAARVLGVGEVEVLDHEDGMLPWVDASTLESDIARAIRRWTPDVLVTFDRDGLYWHPDHIAVHERVTAVVGDLGVDAPALYYVTVPRGAMRSLVDAGMRDPACAGTPSPAILGVDDVDAIGSGAPAPTLLLEPDSCATRKLAAIRAHRTQVERSVIDCMDARVAAGLLAAEGYRRAEVGRPGETFLDHLGTPVPASPVS